MGLVTIVPIKKKKSKDPRSPLILRPDPKPCWGKMYQPPVVSWVGKMLQMLPFTKGAQALRVRGLRRCHDDAGGSGGGQRRRLSLGPTSAHLTTIDRSFTIPGIVESVSPSGDNQPTGAVLLNWGPQEPRRFSRRRP